MDCTGRVQWNGRIFLSEYKMKHAGLISIHAIYLIYDEDTNMLC